MGFAAIVFLIRLQAWGVRRCIGLREELFFPSSWLD